MNIDTNGIEIGDTVRDSITGLEGKAICVMQYTTGCARVGIQAPLDKDGKVPDPYYADVLTVEVVTEGPRHATTLTEAASKGGPPPGYRLGR